MHAHALEYLLPQASEPNARILDVGVGSGYLAAVIARFNPSARIIGIDYIPGKRGSSTALPTALSPVLSMKTNCPSFPTITRLFRCSFS
jgi:Protein-L-isoaspartate(D-aspartate) O-methyltransferase (PCMT)